MNIAAPQTKKEQRHPYDYYRKPGDPLRPPPERIRPTPRYYHLRNFLFGDLRDVQRDVLPEFPGDIADRVNDVYWEGDELIDNVVLAIKDGTCSRAMLGQALKFGIDSVDSPPDALIALFDQIDNDPEWLDREKLERGARIFSNIPLFIALLATTLEIVLTVDSNSVALATGATGRFVRQKENRTLESLTLFTTMCEPGGMGRHGRGLEVCLHIRLMHGFVRHALMRKEDLFDFAVHGNPVPSGDTVTACSIFGPGQFLVLRGFGVELKKDELEDVDMLYRYMGYMLGGHPSALDRTYEESLFAMDYFWATLGEPSQFSDTMKKAFFLGVKESMIERSSSKIEKILTEVVYSHFFCSFLWYMLGDEHASEMKYIKKPTILTRYVPHLYKLYNKIFIRRASFDRPYNSAFSPDGTFIQRVKSLLKLTKKEAEVTYSSHDSTTSENLRSVNEESSGKLELHT